MVYMDSSTNFQAPPRLAYLCLPHEMGRHIVFSSVVCLSVRPSVRHTFVSALYLLNPWLDFQITLHKCQVWWVDDQCLCLTKVGSRSRSQFKIKHCMTEFGVHYISFEPLVGLQITLHMLSMMRRCAVPRFDQCRFQGQGQRLRLKIVRLYFESALYLLNPWWDLQITFLKY